MSYYGTTQASSIANPPRQLVAPFATNAAIAGAALWFGGIAFALLLLVGAALLLEPYLSSAVVATALIRQLAVPALQAELLPQLADTAELVAFAQTLPGLVVSVLVPNLKGAQAALAAGAHKLTLPVSASAVITARMSYTRSRFSGTRWRRARASPACQCFTRPWK